MLKAIPWGAVYDDFYILQKIRDSFFRSAAPVYSLQKKLNKKICFFENCGAIWGHAGAILALFRYYYYYCY